MKKFLGIVVLGLLIFSEHALSLELNNCFRIKYKDANSFDDEKNFRDIDFKYFCDNKRV